MANKLPPLPVGVAPGSGYWNDWYEKLRKIINDLIGGVGHNTLAGLQGGQAGEYYHLTQAEHTSIVAGLDSWTYVKLTSDQVVTTTSGTTTALAFTPAANTLYEVEGQLWLQSSDIASGPQPGITWNTGNSDGVAHIVTTETATASVAANIPTGTDAAALATSFPDTTNSYPAQVKASFKTGASPSGAFTITLARS
jgi:hypothetical protein